MNLTALLLAAVLTGTSDAPLEAGHEPYYAGLLEELRYGPEDRRDSARERLLASGESRALQAFGVLTGRVPVSSTRGPLLDHTARELLFESLAAAGPSVLPRLAATFDEETPLQERLLLLNLVGRVGRAQDLTMIREVLAPLEPVQLAVKAVGDAVQAAVLGLLERDPATNQRLIVDQAEWDPRLLPAVARALGEFGRGDGMKVLERMFGQTLELDEAVLEALGCVRAWETACLSGECSRTLSQYMTGGEPRLRRQAFLSLGKVRERTVFPDVVAALEDDDPRVQGAAAWALQEISGLTRGHSADWNEWYRAEEAWYEGRAQELLDEVRDEDASAAVRALEELSAHRIYARELIMDLAPDLEHADPKISEAVCWAMVRLGHASAVEPLLRAATDAHRTPTPGVLEALSRLTGESFATREEWRAWAARSVGT